MKKMEMPKTPKGSTKTGAQAGIDKMGSKGSQHGKMAALQNNMKLHPGHTPPGKPH